MHIALLRTADHRYGGSHYESMVAEALTHEHQLTVHKATPWISFARRPQSMARMWALQMHVHPDVWIRNEVALCCMRATRKADHIGIIHHMNSPAGRLSPLDRTLQRQMVENAARCRKVVVVSKYWKEQLAKLGIYHSVLIHNAFDVERFTVKDRDLQRFKAANQLEGKTVIYIGNGQKIKGVEAVWHALKDEGYELVASGVSDIDLPIRRFQLPYDEYILLLASCDVAITMSQFEEGWNRTAHEAMLCGTPVIGSGAGGMRELLEGGSQLICENTEGLPQLVRYALSHRAQLGDAGSAFARQFTLQKFNKQWRTLVAELEDGNVTDPVIPQNK